MEVNWYRRSTGSAGAIKGKKCALSSSYSNSHLLGQHGAMDNFVTLRMKAVSSGAVHVQHRTLQRLSSGHSWYNHSSRESQYSDRLTVAINGKEF